MKKKDKRGTCFFFFYFVGPISRHKSPAASSSGGTVSFFFFFFFFHLTGSNLELLRLQEGGRILYLGLGLTMFTKGLSTPSRTFTLREGRENHLSEKRRRMYYYYYPPPSFECERVLLENLFFSFVDLIFFIQEK